MALSGACLLRSPTLQGLSRSGCDRARPGYPVQTLGGSIQSQSLKSHPPIKCRAAVPNHWETGMPSFGKEQRRLQRTRPRTLGCRAAADADYAPSEERARIAPCEQAPTLKDLVSGKWLEKTKQQGLLVAERLAIGAQEIEEELLAPEQLTAEEIAEFEQDPNVALILNLRGDLVGTYIGSEQAVAWVKNLDREAAVAWFWNRLEEDNYRRFLAKGGDWWRGEEWEERPPYWYEYTRKDGKRVVWGQKKRLRSHSVEEFTVDTLERVARFLVIIEEGKGSLASQPEGSLGQYLRDRILESKACWLVDGTISPPVSELEAGDEKWPEYMQRKWKEFTDGLVENKFDAWKQGVEMNNKIGQQYLVPKKFGWKGPVHRTM